jgi:Cof subfamily protein (haloacid dehalogenase superfamily)
VTTQLHKAKDLSSSESATKIRLLVLDIDGTIMDQSFQIRGSVAQAVELAKRRGVAVAIATGRLYQSSLHAYHSIGSTLPLICYEGALIREPITGIVHLHWPLETRVAVDILNYVERLSLEERPSVHFHIQDQLYVSELNQETIEFYEGSGVEPIVVKNLRDLLTTPITKVSVLGNDGGVFNRLSSLLKNSDSRIRISVDRTLTLLEAMHPAANKRAAVSYLAEKLMALQPENVMSIGDDVNDVEMFQYAGISVAMGNAPREVKACADWVTANVEDDGVAQAVEKWISC